MGRDRAKEKIVAHRKARFEKKEQAKAEQRQVQRDRAAMLIDPLPDEPTGRRRKSDRFTRKKTTFPAAAAAAGVNTSGETDPGGLDLSKTEDYLGDSPKFKTGGNEASSSATFKCNEGASTSGSVAGGGGGAAFYAGGNPNHLPPVKPAWRYEYEDALRAKNRGRTSFDNSSSSSTSRWRVEDYFEPEDILALKGLRGGAKQENILMSHPSVAAVALNRFDILKKILKEDNALESMTSDGQYLSPLGCAIIHENWEMILFILDKANAKSVNCKDSAGNTALMKAALCSDWTEAKFMELFFETEIEKIDLVSPNLTGATLIHILSFRGWEKALDTVVMKLIELHPQKVLSRVPASINAPMKDGATPLMLAVEGGSEEICKYLLDNGASLLAEDKAGYTAICRSLSGASASPLEFPIFTTFLTALDKIQGKNWNFEIYFTKTLQAVINPPSDAVFACERFYRLGRLVFLFILRHVVGGPGWILGAKFFSKLTSAGQKHINQIDYVYTICLTFFEILVYSEDLPCWSKFVDAFVKQGADFCLKLLQRCTSIVDTDGAGTGAGSGGDGVSKPSKSHSSTMDQDGDGFDPLARIECPVPSDKNMVLSALLPFIQLIDAEGMDPWFSKNFATISTCYKNIQQLTLNLSASTTLSGEHVTRTNQKACLFLAFMSQEKWISMYQSPEADSESWMLTPREYKLRKKQLSQTSVENKAASFPDEILRPPLAMILKNEPEPSPEVKGETEVDLDKVGEEIKNPEKKEKVKRVRRKKGSAQKENVPVRLLSSKPRLTKQQQQRPKDDDGGGDGQTPSVETVEALSSTGQQEVVPAEAEVEEIPKNEEQLDPLTNEMSDQFWENVPDPPPPPPVKKTKPIKIKHESNKDLVKAQLQAKVKTKKLSACETAEKLGIFRNPPRKTQGPVCDPLKVAEKPKDAATTASATTITFTSTTATVATNTNSTDKTFDLAQTVSSTEIFNAVMQGLPLPSETKRTVSVQTTRQMLPSNNPRGNPQPRRRSRIDN